MSTSGGGLCLFPLLPVIKTQVHCLLTTRPTSIWIGGPKTPMTRGATSPCATYWPFNQAMMGQRHQGPHQLPLAGVSWVSIAYEGCAPSYVMYWLMMAITRVSSYNLPKYPEIYINLPICLYIQSNTGKGFMQVRHQLRRTTTRTPVSWLLVWSCPVQATMHSS